MQIEFSSPPLVVTTKKLQGALEEWSRLNAFISTKPLDTENAVLRWSALTTIGSAIHNIYNGFEDVMKTLCKSVDGYVPSGSSSHQEILDQMSSPMKDGRPELIGQDWYADMNELRGFRHVVNHNYANELRDDLVLKNYDRLSRVMPLFIEALQQLDAFLSGPAEPEDGARKLPDPFEN